MAIHRKHTAAFKVNVVLEGLSCKKKISTICQEKAINANLFYKWRKIFIDSGTKAFSNKRSSVDGKLSVEAIIHRQEQLISKLYHEIEQYKKALKANPIKKKHHYSTYQKKHQVFELLEQLDLPKNSALKLMGVSPASYYRWKQKGNYPSNNTAKTIKIKKYENPVYKEAVFTILHSPPKEYGINRTTWRMQDLYQVMKAKGLFLSKHAIKYIIKKEGYSFKKAKTVLTSTDPEYREKLIQITTILSNLGPKDKFFSIDEFGPFAVKMQGGKSLMPLGESKVVPQFQKSKGCLILTAALELSTNQVTHFYSEKKNTMEMIKLLELLLTQYSDQDSIYLSWDAASWHASNKLYEKVHDLNNSGNKPFIMLAPLPACAQFLNVIESVFSGMAKAVIHNSNYQSVEDCKTAIDKHFEERNQYFIDHPKRAGNKIWGKERSKPRFNESNNCKDPIYQHKW